MVCKLQRPGEADLENMIPHPLSIQTCRLIPQGTKCVNKEMSEDKTEVPGAEAQSRAAVAVVVRQRVSARDALTGVPCHRAGLRLQWTQSCLPGTMAPGLPEMEKIGHCLPENSKSLPKTPIPGPALEVSFHRCPC